MKRSQYLLLIVSTLFIFSTCKKQKETILDFTFTDSYSKKPIQDLEIYLQEFDQDQFGNITNMRTLDSYKTNANGNLFVKLKYLNPEKQHGIEWQKPSECYEHGYGPYHVEIGQENKYERTLIARGLLIAKIKNVQPFSNNDSIFFCYRLSRELDQFCFAHNAIVGSNIDYDFTISPYANAKYYFFWKVIKNGIANIYTDSIATIPCDTVNYNLFY